MSPDALAKAAPAAVTAALRKASAATGSSFELLYNMARRESALDPAAKAKTSSAAGLFQFIEQTWLGAVRNYGARHGLADAALAIEKSMGGAGVLPAPEQKSASVALAAPPLRWGSEAPSRDASGLARLFAMREPEKPAGLSPLALAVLQALDPGRLLKGDGTR